MTSISISDRALLQWIAYRCNLDLEHTRSSAIADINSRARGFRVKTLADRGLVRWFEQQGVSLAPYRMLLESAAREAVRVRAPHVIIGPFIFEISYQARGRGFERVWMFEKAILEGVTGRAAVPMPLVYARAI